MQAQETIEEQAEASALHRAYPGPRDRYDLEAATQFNLLTSLGLREHHTVLEVGCGGLGLARLLIPYLQAGSYHGVESQRWLIDAGIRHECGESLLALRQPRFEESVDSPSFLGCKFDYVIAASWFLDSSPEEVRDRVSQLLPYLREDSVLLIRRPLKSTDPYTDESLAKLLRSTAELNLSNQILNIERCPGHVWVVVRKVQCWIAEGLPATPSNGGLAQPVSGAGDRKLAEELARYRDCINVHDLPEMYHLWSNRYVRPKLQACGFDNVDDFFLQHIVRFCRETPASTHAIASIGAGNCDLEVRLAGLVRSHGFDNFHFYCIELNPHMVERGRKLAVEQGVERHFTFQILKVADWHPERSFAICMANHSLHHIVELEDLFAKIKSAIGTTGAFLTNDMIGRNGHMRWPEALRIVEEIWAKMPRRYKYNHQLRRLEEEFDNWDCSKEGNEGIRAQDILPLLVETFHFEAFVAFANVIDVFVDRSFGHNFDVDNAEDRAFIEEIAQLDEAKLDAGEVKPTHLIAAMRAVPSVERRVYKHWTPEFCVRLPESR